MHLSDKMLSIDRQLHPRWLFPASSDSGPLGTVAAGYLLPVIVVLPVLCGLLVFAAERAGWLATPGALLISVAAGVAGTSTATLLVARWLNRVATSRDATENTQAEAEIARGHALFEGLFEYAPDAVIAVDMEGCVRLVNRQAEELFGYSKQELLGLPVETLLPDRARPSHIALRERYTASPDRRPRRDDVIGLRKDGAEFPAAVALGPINLSSGMLVLASVRDVSEERQDKDTIQRLKADLSRNADELKTVNDELKSFSYSVSHDLRAPLRSMVGYSTIILEDFDDALPPEAKGHLGRIIAATNKMGELIDGLLALSRIIRRDMVRQNVDLSVLAEEALQHLRAGTPARDVSIRVAEKLRVVGDRQLLQIAVTNLVDNAWKFTRHTAHPKIEVGVAIEKGQPVYFVRDNGVGFDMKYADKLFGAFQKLHGERDYEGPGIGLATAHRVILRHGGALWATAEPGQGATFYFTLPQPVEGGDE